MENGITKNFELFHFQYCFISKKGYNSIFNNVPWNEMENETTQKF